MRICNIRLIFISIFITHLVFAQVYTTYHWHLQQPIYWPDQSGENSNTYEKAWHSLNNGGSHPENDLEQIFGWADRVAAYQFRIRDAIESISAPDGGAQISYSGCLVENVQSLADHNSLGYSPGWQNSFQEAIGWNTSGGNPKLDVVIFSYHHALCPLIDENSLRKEIQIYKELYPQIWSSDISLGFFPSELSFSMRMIKVLVEEGIDWVFVPNNHISRACENFPLILGSAGENCDPPNPADQINPPQSNWYSKYIDRGCTPTNAYPYSYQPHYAAYVDPETGEEFRIIVVPVAQAMSWDDGYSSHGTEEIDQIAWANDPAQPMLIVLGHDGDNAWGGGYSYYLESVPNFTSQAYAAGYFPTVVQEYLQDHPVDWNDLVHVEDGSWVNADGDFGSPDFINWNWPLVNSSGNFDIANGWAEDERNWAVITAAQNRVETAEQIMGSVDPAAIQDPMANGANEAELAWHFFLPALTSGYMYYGSALDMEVKPTIACNNAVEHADQIIGDGSSDNTAPTIWLPQQLPHNPGGIGFGALWGYQQTPQNRDFWIWSFIYDVSGISSVNFRYRIDNDGQNPLTSHHNETYLGGSEVGEWVSLPMNMREFPAENIFNNPEIDFFEMPQYIADEYYIHVTEPTLIDSGGVLIDYYVEAIDNLGYIKKSPIQHTFIGEGGGTFDSPAVDWQPEEPEAGDTLVISYDITLGTLPNSTSQVYIHIGHSGWQNIITPDPLMDFDSQLELWVFNYIIPGFASSVEFVFNDGEGNWDNNSGQNWTVPVTGGIEPEGYVMDGLLDPSASLIASNDERQLFSAWNGQQLYVAATPANGTGADHFIFISDGTSELINAPWAKNGQVAQWAAFLGNEESNGWAGWFDLNGGTYADVTSGSILEGIIALDSEFEVLPGSVWLALGAYQSNDNGTLIDQLPESTDGNPDIEFFEFIEFQLTTVVELPGDVNADGILDILDIVRMVSIIMGEIIPSEYELQAADVTEDGIIDILDVVLLVELVMGN